MKKNEKILVVASGVIFKNEHWQGLKTENLDYYLNLIKNNKSINFSFLLKEKKDKTETVVSFLAMLELVKQREIVVSQTQLFGELSINRYYSKINN